MSSIKKRFIAGAKCPQCHAQDSILIFKQQGIETIECVECHYQKQQTQQASQKQTNEQSIPAEKQPSSETMIGVFKP